MKNKNSYFRQIGTPRPKIKAKSRLNLSPAGSTFVLFLIAILAITTAYFLDDGNTGLGSYFGVAALSLVSLSIVLHVSKQSKESEQMRDDLILAFESSDAAEMVSDPDGKIVFANSQWADTIDTRSGEAITPLETFIAHDADTTGKFHQLVKSSLQGEIDKLEFPLQLISGLAHFRLTALPLKFRHGYIRWRLEDITNHVEHQQTLIK